MTQQQFIEEIKQLSVAERVALIEAIKGTLREEGEQHPKDATAPEEETRVALTQDEIEKRLAAVRRLRGVFKTSGATPSNEEISGAYDIKSAAVRSLYGSLKFDNPPMTREEERELITDYLMEKYL